MSQIYMKSRAPRKGVPAPRKAAGPSVTELAAGASPTAAQMGSRVDLPGEIREKMEGAFGADFSNVKLYESAAVADAGAQAVARGSDIAFAPGKLDLTSTAGQALLGHELSHVVSQARGESAGRGFLNDPHLEAQADRQGMLAARGESVYQGPVGPIGVSSAVSASGPMQAKKHEEKADIQMERTGMQGNARDLGCFDRRKLAKAYDAEEKRRKSLNMPVTGETAGNASAAPRIEDAKTPRERQAAQAYAIRMASGQTHAAKTGLMVNAANDPTKDYTPEDFNNWFNEEFEQGGRDKVKYKGDIELKTGEGNALGITLDRSGKELRRLAAEQGMSDEEIRQMLVDAALKSRRDAADPNSENEEERARAASESERTNAALKKIKNVYYGGIKSARDKYGVMLTQLHPEDALNQAGDLWKDTHWTQDTMNMLSMAPELFDPENEEDQEFASLTQYFMATQMMLQMYGDYADSQALEQSAGIPNMSRDMFRRSFNNAKRNEANVLAGDRSGILKMGEKEKRAYRRKAKEKHGNVGLANLFDNEDESVDLAGLQEADNMPVNENEHIDTISDLYRKRYGNT